MKKANYLVNLLILSFLLPCFFTTSANAQAKGAWVEYQLPGDRPVNWARMVGENCLIFIDRTAPEIYAFDINSAEWHTYTAATALEWSSQIKVGRNVAFVYNDEMAVAYNGLTQTFAPVSYTGTMLPGTTYGHDCETDMAYLATDQYFYVFDGEDNVWRNYDISGAGDILSWGIYGIEDYLFLVLNETDDSKTIVAYSYLTKTFTRYDGDGNVEYRELNHGFIFYKNNTPAADSLNHFFAGYSAYSGNYVLLERANNSAFWNSMSQRGHPGTTAIFEDRYRIVDNNWQLDIFGFDTRYGNFVETSYNYEYVCQNGIQPYVTSAGSSIGVNSYRDCVDGELTYIVYKGNTNSFQTALEEGLYYPACGTNAQARCGGEVFGASDCNYMWFFDTENWLGSKVALPAPVDGFSNPASQRMYGTWGIGECKRVGSDNFYFYSYNQNGNNIQTRQVPYHNTSPGRLDSTNVGGVYAPYLYGDTLLLLYSPGTDTWIAKNLSIEGTDWAFGVQRDFIYYYDYGGSGSMNIFDGVTGMEISLSFGWAYYSTANGRKYTWPNFMLVHSADDIYSGYSTYTRTHSEYASEYLSSWTGQKDLALSFKTISGGGADILAYNVLYDNFVMTSYGTEYGTFFDIWVGGKTALIMTLPGYLMAWAPHADAITDVEENVGNNNLPEVYSLSQNYPNPFNPSTTIKYSIPKRTDVTISVYNLLGRKIRTITIEKQSAGEHEVNWDGTDQSGKAVASGIYFYRLTSGNYTESKKMILLK